ncbi:MAG: hypothetical protein HYR77_01465 [Ignavibacteria bacterium]|nr:hypothetical protein [Ignavibacteria bacterium]
MGTEKKSIILLVLIVISALQFAPAQTERGTAVDVKQSLVKFIKTLPPASTVDSTHEEMLAFFLRFVDFGCAVCLNNFLDLCDSLEANALRSGSRRIVLIFRRDANRESYQMRTLRKWSDASNLHFPIFLMSAEFFRRHGIDYSSIILVDRKEDITFFQKIPLSNDKQTELIDALFLRSR